MTRGNARRTYWAKFDACPWCDALPGNPCKETLTGLMYRSKTTAHHNRPLKEQNDQDKLA
jgi:hypothetical protein